MKIALVTTCKHRLEHLRATLPANIKDSPSSDSVFVVLDYNDDEGLAEYILCEHANDLASGKLIYYQNRDAPRFHMAHAKNQAMRCAFREGADIVCTIDSDNFIGPGFTSFVKYKFESDQELAFLCPDFRSMPPPGKRVNANDPLRLARGMAGRLAIRSADFIKAGGYDETFSTWKGEDTNLIARLDRLGLKKGYIDTVFLKAIAHSAAVRFREYPAARRFEGEDVYTFEKAENSHDTIVNNGRLGCGEVFRNFDGPISINAVPTKVFGIGMQRTGTTSLHEAFLSLGLDSAHWKSAEWAQTIWREVNKWGRSRTLERHYAICDNPIPMLYEKLDRAYPGSKFVLTVRDEDTWVQSIEKFWTYEGNPQRWTWDGDGFSHKMHGITYGTIEFDERIFRERYRRHNDEVERYFAGRPDDFLRLDMNEDLTMEPLCRFLRLPATDRAFPHSHKSGSYGWKE